LKTNHLEQNRAPLNLPAKGIALDPAHTRALASRKGIFFRRNTHMRPFVFAIALFAMTAFVRAQDAASTPFLAKTPATSEETPTPSAKPKASPTATAKPSPKATVKPLQSATPEPIASPMASPAASEG
jgi:hypothetical protein